MDLVQLLLFHHYPSYSNICLIEQVVSVTLDFYFSKIFDTAKLLALLKLLVWEDNVQHQDWAFYSDTDT